MMFSLQIFRLQRRGMEIRSAADIKKENHLGGSRFRLGI